MKVLAKFECVLKASVEGGHDILLEPVTTGCDENDTFFEYTPYGRIELGIVKGDAANTFVEGNEYYVTFSDVANEAITEPKPEKTFLTRLKLEHYELTNRCEGLLTFLGSDNLSKVSSEQQALLKAQYEHMTNYLNVLSERLQLLEGK